jgi:hypothetical protein
VCLVIPQILNSIFECLSSLLELIWLDGYIALC